MAKAAKENQILQSEEVVVVLSQVIFISLCYQEEFTMA